MLLLMLLTSITLYLVAANMALLAAGWRSLPSQVPPPSSSSSFLSPLISSFSFLSSCSSFLSPLLSSFSSPLLPSSSLTQSAGAALLGATSLSSLGVVGVVIEVVVIAYLFLTRCPGSRYFGGGGYVLCFVCGGVDALSWWWWWLCDVSW